MQRTQLIIFYSTFILLYAALNYYIFIRGWQSLSDVTAPSIRGTYIVIFLLLSLSFILAQFSGKLIPAKFTEILSHISGFWLGAMLYFILIILFLDILRGIGNGFSIIPDTLFYNWGEIKIITFTISVLVVAIILIVGNFNARRLRVSEVEIEINKSAGEIDHLNIVFASDIHLGHVIGEKMMDQLISTINKINPDLVLFPGDLVDREIESVISRDLGRRFRKLKPRFGVFASTGNHEYIGGAENAVSYLEQNGITFLRDEVVTINNSFSIAGREDQNMSTFAGSRRKQLKDILDITNHDLPIIVMDHQPISLSESAENLIDLQISGHTHNGQMWPLNYLTNRIFKLSWGYKKINDTHFYVSCGAGTWGPRVRVGSFGEVVLVNLTFVGG